MLGKRTATANHMRRIYYHYEEFIKKSYFGPCKAMAITQDAWTSPNNVPFMSLTGHFINENWELMDLSLGIAEIKGTDILSKSCYIKVTH